MEKETILETLEESTSTTETTNSDTISEKTEATYICKKCKTEYSESQKFCGKCGGKIINKEILPTQNICPNCNTENDLDSTFCISCGKKIKCTRFLYNFKTRIKNNKKKSLIIFILSLLLITIPVVIFITVNSDNDTVQASESDNSSETDTDVKEYTLEEEELYQTILNGYGKIKNGLKNPDSLKVYGVRLYVPDDTYIIYRITATNGFGGTVTNYYAYDPEYDSLMDDCQVLYNSGDFVDWNEVVAYSEYKYGN